MKGFGSLEVPRLESLVLGGARLGFGSWGCPAWGIWGLGVPRLGFWGLGMPAWGPWRLGVPRLGVFGAWGAPPGVLGAWGCPAWLGLAHNLDQRSLAHPSCPSHSLTQSLLTAVRWIPRRFRPVSGLTEGQSFCHHINVFSKERILYLLRVNRFAII